MSQCSNHNPEKLWQPADDEPYPADEPTEDDWRDYEGWLAAIQHENNIRPPEPQDFGEELPW